MRTQLLVRGRGPCQNCARTAGQHRPPPVPNANAATKLLVNRNRLWPIATDGHALWPAFNACHSSCGPVSRLGQHSTSNGAGHQGPSSGGRLPECEAPRFCRPASGDPVAPARYRCRLLQSGCGLSRGARAWRGPPAPIQLRCRRGPRPTILTTLRREPSIVVPIQSIARRGVTPARIVRTLGGFVRFWLPVFVVLFLYDAIHNRIGMIQPAHAMPQMRLEQVLFGSPVPTVRMQAALYAPERPHWWDFATLAVYMSHFFVAIAIALALWIRSRVRYFRFMVWFRSEER